MKAHERWLVTLLPSRPQPKSSLNARFTKAPIFRRLIADFVDRAIPLPFLAYFFPFWLVICRGYDLMADMRGASVGKRLVGLEVVIVPRNATRHGPRCNPRCSIRRNGIWCLSPVLSFPISLLDPSPD